MDENVTAAVIKSNKDAIIKKVVLIGAGTVGLALTLAAAFSKNPLAGASDDENHDIVDVEPVDSNE